MIIEQIKNTDKFTSAEKTIIDFLLKNSENLADITIKQLADAAFSSNATIIRFCRKLGFDGYKDFRLAFVKEMEACKYLDHEIDYTHPFQVDEPTDVVVGNIYSLYKKSMDQVRSCLVNSELDEIVNLLMKAEHIFLYGYGDVSTTLRGFINMLVKIGIFPVFATEASEEEHISEHVTKKDIVLCVTYRGKNSTLIRCMKTWKKKGASHIVITANPESLLVKYSTKSIIVPNMERPDRISTFYSQLAFEYILNVIFALIYQKHPLK